MIGGFSILAVSVGSFLGRLLPYRYPVVGGEHPASGMFRYAILADVVMVKSCVNSFFVHVCVPVRVSIFTSFQSGQCRSCGRILKRRKSWLRGNRILFSYSATDEIRHKTASVYFHSMSAH